MTKIRTLTVACLALAVSLATTAMPASAMTMMHHKPMMHHKSMMHKKMMMHHKMKMMHHHHMMHRM